MAGRPAARKSNLAGSSPVKPVEAAAAAPAAAEPQQSEPKKVTKAAPAAPKPAAEEPAKKRKYPHKVSFYQDMTDTDRVRGAILHTMISEGNRNLSQFIHKAVMKEVERLEAEYNGGKPWPSVKANDMPQGAASHGDKED
ncbi:ParB family protein [Glutamicibacter arilaitensis]|uniref:ParB family protein n=1 Tax=Glutamicibacter arilaitensis TaxID=256701 RepID=UPI003FD440B4